MGTIPAPVADIGPMAVSRQSARAGGYAEQRYRRGRARWQARTRLLLGLCFGPFILLGLAGVILEPHLLAWTAGVAFGVGFGAWAALRESPPAYIENWRTGAEGERKTGRVLRRLSRARWLVVHDVQTGRGNYDHIVTGLAGVFLPSIA